MKTGYKSNRATTTQIECDYQKSRLKKIDEIEKRQKLSNLKRIEKGLEPKEYEPITRECSPITPEIIWHILNGSKGDENE